MCCLVLAFKLTDMDDLYPYIFTIKTLRYTSLYFLWSFLQQTGFVKKGTSMYISLGMILIRKIRKNKYSMIIFFFVFIDKPSPPKGPAVQQWKTDDSKELRWNAPENDGGDKISEYVVERREKGKKSWKQVGLTQAGTTSIEIKGLKKDTSYDFRVSAKNSVGVSSATIIEETAVSKKQSIAQSQSQASLATSASTTEVAAKAKSVPGAPRNVQVTAVTSLSVTLQWIPPASNGGADLTGYIIEKRIGTSHTWEKAATVDTSVTEYTVENLKEKCQYYLRVSAENEIGVGEAATTEKVVLKTSASKYR